MFLNVCNSGATFHWYLFNPIFWLCLLELLNIKLGRTTDSVSWHRNLHAGCFQYHAYTQLPQGFRSVMIPWWACSIWGQAEREPQAHSEPKLSTTIHEKNM